MFFEMALYVLDLRLARQHDQRDLPLRWLRNRGSGGFSITLAHPDLMGKGFLRHNKLRFRSVPAGPAATAAVEHLQGFRKFELSSGKGGLQAGEALAHLCPARAPARRSEQLYLQGSQDKTSLRTVPGSDGFSHGPEGGGDN